MTIVEAFRQDEARVLDRLVDGELSQQERRELLAALDDEVGAWRRCALAFLESQSWRSQMSRLAWDPLAEIGSTAEKHPVTAGKHAARFWSLCLAVAASILVAFALGTQFASLRQEAAPALLAKAPQPQAAVQPDDLETSLDPDDPLAEQPGWETLLLSGTANAGGDPDLTLRVTAADDGDEQWLADAGSLFSDNDGDPVSAEILRQLQLAGLEVTRQQRWMPVDLSDGRRMVVPIEEFEIHSPEVIQY